MIKRVAMRMVLVDEMPLTIGYRGHIFQKSYLFPEVVAEDGSPICCRELWRTTSSVRADKTLASAMDNKLTGVVDKDEGHPRVQRMVHPKLRRSAIKLFDYECRKTHG